MPLAAQELQRHDRDGPVHAGHARAVVAHGADGAGDVRAVAVVVHRVAVVGDEIVAVDVADEAVASSSMPLPAISPGFVQMLAARSGWV